ncbi:molybdate ABC transporter substrate-binding protein [Sphingobium sufflavum]|uniref:molybdate ABC transporter substrate-binding protein n=1 Tax=Sphingobium sufflavum TaxID=1129547 RepID=UPI001F20A178|nr:molybdate ABC transporter substrate-binding protein [Sphingobium sufflavum]MCE7797176.1 molybdate ABC transporter substrate-binding protein [Sphingobium sufflavum]
MNRIDMRHRASRLCLFLLVLLAGVAPAGAQGGAAPSKGPLVLAAASLQESLTAAADVWTARRHPRPILSFAASSALARQIGSGAPADLFISADEPWMDDVAAKGLLRPGTRLSYISNRLVLVASVGHPVKLTIRRKFPLAAALGTGRLAMADPDSVPAGKYGKAALTALGVWSSVEPRVARAENVRAALALVERGEAPLGIVYATDALASKGVRVIGTFPASSHPPITYPIAVLKSATSRDAESFRRFLISREGKAIFARYGFTPR